MQEKKNKQQDTLPGGNRNQGDGDTKLQNGPGKMNDGSVTSQHQEGSPENDEGLNGEDLAGEDPVLDEEDLEENNLTDEEADNIEWDEPKEKE